MTLFRLGRNLRCTALAAVFALLAGSVASAAEEVNIYSYRQPVLIAPLLKAFTEKTGIKTNVVFAEEGLADRMAAEGANSPADLLFTVDIGRLQDAKEKGVTQPVQSSAINDNIPAKYRDPEGHWFGLTTRARVVYASKERVKQDAITYEELADPKWKGRICMRAGNHVYNVALIASMIAHHGAAKAEEWLRGVKQNLARKPAGNDRNQVKGIYSGECDLAVANTYYMALMMTNEQEPEQKLWAASARIIFPNTHDRGTHVNISGMALAKYAPNKDNALKLMAFLASEEGQEIYARVNNEFPVKPGVPAGEIAKSWGSFKADDLSIATIGKLRKEAIDLVDKVGFNEGPSS